MQTLRALLSGVLAALLAFGAPGAAYATHEAEVLDSHPTSGGGTFATTIVPSSWITPPESGT